MKGKNFPFAEQSSMIIVMIHFMSPRERCWVRPPCNTRASVQRTMTESQLLNPLPPH